MISLRDTYKKIEPITLVGQFTTGLTVKLDLFEAATGTAILTNRTVPEIDSVNLPGIYSITLSVSDLDGFTVEGNPVDEMLVLWRLRPVPASSDDPIQYGTFYRGGWIDQFEKSKQAQISFATVSIPERNVRPTAISHVDYPLGYGKMVRMMFFYRAGSNDPESVVTSVIDV